MHKTVSFCLLFKELYLHEFEQRLAPLALEVADQENFRYLLETSLLKAFQWYNDHVSRIILTSPDAVQTLTIK